VVREPGGREVRVGNADRVRVAHGIESREQLTGEQRV
jgi:hypothetical protein